MMRGMPTKRGKETKTSKVQATNGAKARKNDAFCKKMMRNGQCEDAVEWIKTKNHTLGEMESGPSRRLVAKLVKLGALAIHACDVETDDLGDEGELQNTGHLLVELPSVAGRRAAILQEMDRLAQAQGFDDDETMDDGQRYAYVKLD
jgi:hypothetical protein